ncbi:MAG: HAMP domain-containing sensor histidine kinase [Myxococcota bacterium]
MSEVLLISPNRAVVRRIERAYAPVVPAQTLVVVETLADARAALAGASFGVVLADLQLPDGQATALLGSGGPSFPLVVLVNEGDTRPEGLPGVDYVVRSPGTLAALPHITRGAVREFAQLQRARVAEDHLRHADRLIGTGRLAAVMAHEVGTPLNVARMQAQILAARPGVSDGTRVGCRTIVEQLDLISVRIRGMLDYARSGVPGRSTLALHEAVGSAVHMLRPLAVRKGIDVRLEAQPLVVVANRSEVQQVVFNLVANALDALGTGGHVAVRIRSDARDDGVFALVEVQDDGPGVPDAIRARVFDAFFTTKAAGVGTGLGLSVCRDIAAAHHGFLSLESCPGTTVFTLGLPVQNSLLSISPMKSTP